MTIILSVLMSFVSFANLSEEGWKEQGMIDGFKVFTRDEPNSSIKGVRAQGVIKADLPTVMAHLRDVPGSAKWTPDMKEKITVSEASDIEAVTYSITTMPWPLKNRDMIIHNKLFLDKEKKLLYVMSKSVEHEKYPVVKKFERAYITYSNLGMRPVSQTETYIDFTVFADPNGYIPSWIVNYFQKRWPSSFLRALEKEAQRTKPALLPGLKATLDELLAVMSLPAGYYAQK